MAQEFSFDIVSKVDLNEVRNAIQQAQKEIQTRFDFRGTQASIAFDAQQNALLLTADHEVQLKSVLDVAETRLAKRNVPVRAVQWKPPEQLPGGLLKRRGVFVQGLDDAKAKAVTRSIKELKLKVQPRIQGDLVRVTGKSKDELQQVMQAVQDKDFGVPLQFENYR